MRWPSHPVATILGVVLLAAAGLKVHERLHDPASGDATAGRGWLLLLMAQCEAMLGIWFLSGRAERLARRVAFGLFALFTAYNLYLVAAGQPSCGCLGLIKVNPRFMLLFDLAALAALGLWWRPGRVPRSAPAPASASWGITAAGAALVLGGATLATALTLRQNSPAGGVTVVGSSTYSFGEVLANQQLTHTFELKNGLREPVEIVRLKSNCGCTTADDLAGQWIAPGAVKEVPVSLRAGIVDGHNLFGEVTVFFRREGGDVPAFQVLRVEMTVRTDFDVSAETLDFGPVMVGRTATRTVTLSPRRMTDAQITAAELLAGGLFRAEPPRAGGREVRVSYSPQPASRSGPVGELLTIKTNSPNVPLVHVWLVARRVVPAEVTPMAVVVGPETRGAVTREVVVTSEREFEIRQATSDDARVTARVKSPGRGRSRTLAVTVSDALDGPVNANLALKLKFNDDTTSEEAYRVSVPIHRFQPRGGGL